MPWKPDDAKTHMKGLTPKQQRQWANIANSARQRCIDDGGKPDACDVSAIKQANGVLAKAVKENAMQIRTSAEDLALTELGRTINGNNETLLRQAAQLLVKVIKSIKSNAKADDTATTTDDAETDDTPADAKEAGTFNQSDTFALLQSALQQTNGGNGYDTYIADVYEDQGYFVYRKGYSGGYYRCDFEISTNGAVTLGNPEQVVRKVTYIAPTTATESGKPITPDADVADLLEVLITEDTNAVQLVERAVADDGTVMLKLIAPGKGSSGYYSTEVLKRDGPRVFTRGMHNFIDHPTPQEEAERPEGSITRIGSTLVEDAYWRDHYVEPKTGKDAGPGLYARAKVSPDFAGTLDEIAANIGTSIRAMGKARMGTIGDYKGPIIEAITSAKSVDYVTMAGAGGKVLSLVEAARNVPNTQGANTMNEEEIKALRESVNALTAGLTAMREANARQGAITIVETSLAQYHNLPAPIRAKLVATLPASAPLVESRDAVDVVAFTPMIEAAVQSELQYVQSIGASMGLGAITGFGSADPITEQTDTTDYAKELTKLFNGPSFGLSEAGAEVAARGRE